MSDHAFEPGQQVQCKTRFDDVIKGEVVAFDLNILDMVSNVEVLEEPHSGFTNKLPNIEMKYIHARHGAALNERLRLIDAIGNGVSQDGISLYTALSKKYDDLIWKDKTKIVVMNAVIISPPYKESDCEPIHQTTQKEAVAYVKSVVGKFWESIPNQKSVV